MKKIFRLNLVLVILFVLAFTPAEGLAEDDPVVEEVTIVEDEPKEREATKKDKEITQKEEEDAVLLEDIMVLETRLKAEEHKKVVFDSPDPVSIITRERIDMLKPKSIGDLFFYEPGVDINDDATYWARKPVIRGLRADRVVIVVDGVRLKTHFGMGGGYLSLIDPDMVEQVEIIKGPKSVLYGSDAIGGVIKITTRKPKDAIEKFHLGGNVNVGFCSVNRMKSANINFAGSKDALQVYGGLSVRRADDYDFPKGGQETSQFKENNVDLNISYDFLEDHNVTCSYTRKEVWDAYSPIFPLDINSSMLAGMVNIPLAADIFALQGMGYYANVMDNMGKFLDYMNDITNKPFYEALNMDPFMKGVMLFDMDSPFLAANFHIGFKEMIYEKYNLNYKISNITSFWDDITFNIYHQDTPMDFFVEIVPEVFGLDMVKMDVGTTFTIKTVGFNLGNSMHYKGHSFKFGIDAYRDRANGDDFGVNIGFPFMPWMPFSAGLEMPPLKADLESVDVFFQDDWKVCDFLTLTLGARYDHTDSVNYAKGGYVLQDVVNYAFCIDELNVDHQDEALTYSAQSVFHLTETINLLAGVATGFRVPNLMERYLMGSIGIATSIANPYLEPEESINYEVGLKGYKPGKWDWQITGFWTDLDDMIVLKVMAWNVVQFVNADEAEMWGAEAAGSYYINNNWSVFANIAYCDGENNSTDTHLNAVPPLNGNLALRYESEKFLRVDDFWAQIEARLVDRYDAVHPTNEYMQMMTSMAPGMGGEESPGFALFNLRCGFDLPKNFAETGMSVNMAVENLLNKEYTEPLSFQRIQPGTNYKLFVTMHF